VIFEKGCGVKTMTNKYSDPIEYLLGLCDEATLTGKWKLDKFTINNARDQLKRLKEKIKDSYFEAFQANKFAAEQFNKNLNFPVDKPVAYARINDRGDLYDLRLTNNPHVDQNTVVPLYR